MQFPIRKFIDVISENNSPRIPVSREIKTKKWSDEELYKQKQQARNVAAGDPGKGAYYKGYNVSADPHVYTKREIQAKDSDEDAQAAYMRKLVKLNGSNPYLPVVYEIKAKQDINTELTKHQFRVQKLTPLNSVSTSFLKTLIAHLFNKALPSDTLNIIRLELEQIKDDYKDIDFRNTPSELAELQKDLRLIIAKMMRYFVNGKLETNDQALQQAATLIRGLSKIKRGKKYPLDIHAGNIMLRSSATGYWPVYNDPLSNYIDKDD